MLRPRTERRVNDGATLIVASVHKVATWTMRAILGSHGADDADFVRLFGHLGHVAAELDAVGIRLERIFEAFGLTVFWIPSVDVGHAATHVESDDSFSLAAFSSRF